MKIAQFVAVAVLGVVLAGCTSGTKSEAVTPVANPAKGILESMAQTGQMTSGIVEVEGEIANLKAQDPAKGEKLAKELDDLKKQSDPSQIKSRAKAIADQL